MRQSELIVREDGSIYHLALKPDEICDTIITVGDPARVGRISRYFDEIHITREHRELVTHRGRIGTTDLMVLSTGMGTGSIEIVLNELDALANVDFETRQIKERVRSLNIIRVGTSGSISDALSVGECMVSDSAIGLDNLMHFYSHSLTVESLDLTRAFQEYMAFDFLPYHASADAKMLEVFGSNCAHGNTITCPGFYLPQGRVIRATPADNSYFDKLLSFQYKNFRLSNMEMETAAYYALGNSLGHRVVSLNAILANRISGDFARDPEGVERSLILHTLDRIEKI